MMKQLTYKELRKLEDLWLSDFHSGKIRESNAVRWWEVFNLFLTSRGDELIPGELRAQEEQVMNLGKSQEYLAALAALLPPAKLCRNDFDSTMLVLTASADDRAAALKKVLK